MGAAVAAIAHRAEREIIDHLRLARALDPSSAVAEPDLPSFVAERRFERLEDAGVVRRTVAGAVYLDEASFIGWRDARRRRRVFVVLLAMAVLVAVGVFGAQASLR